MPKIPVSLRRMAVALAWALLAAVVVAPAAGAAEFGELGRISGGPKGTGLGEFKLEPETDAFGVDPTTNSVYILDEPTEAGFRLQKFSANNGKFEAVASATFNPKGADESSTIEGVAVDPTMHRVYLLVMGERKAGDKIDPSEEVASELWAFSTQQSGSTLEPASGTEAGLVSSRAQLRADGEKYREALLEPHGLTVEPISATEDNVIVAGTVDTGEQTPQHVEITHSSLLWVKSNGELAGKQWTDETELLGDEATSPVVYNSKLYVAAEEQLWEVPAGGAAGPAKPFSRSTPQTEDFWSEQDLVEVPTLDNPEDSGDFSVSSTGKFWTTASIRLSSDNNFLFPGAVEFNASGGEIGYTGGQSSAVSEACSIGINSAPEIAAGSGEDLFVLDTTPGKSKLIEFGPGGKGCPEASAELPTTSVNEIPVGTGQPIPINDTVTMSSKVIQGNALSVEWNFGDGTTETVDELQQCFLEVKAEEGCTPQATLVNHKFAKPGNLEVTETIHTDNLANPIVTVKRKVLIEPNPPTVVTLEPIVGETTATLKGSVNPNGQPTTCEFEYGTTTSYGKTAACEQTPGNGISPVTVTAVVSGLTRETGYHYRLVAKYSFEGKEAEVDSADRPFTTGPKAPIATTGSATGISQTGATLNAKVDPEGDTITSCTFEYGTAVPYSSSTPCSTTPGAVKEEVAVAATVGGLAAASKYHFRIVVKTATKTAEGADASFETAAVHVVTPPPSEEPVTQPPPKEEPKHQVLSYSQARVAIIKVSTVSSSGSFTITLSCPAGTGSCTGTLTLKTAKAVIASLGHEAKAKASVLALASGSFAITAGQSKSITLHLSSKAKALLAKAHSIAAKATFVAHNAGGESTTTSLGATLKPAKKHH